MKIKKITKTSQKEHTWDIEIPDSHSYYVKTNESQVLTHNSSKICGNTNGIEPPRQPITYMKSKGHTLPCLIPRLSRKKSYSYAFDKGNNEGYLKCAAAMNKWICMSISTNLYYSYDNYPDRKLPFKEVIRDHYLGTKWGLKSFYYLNTDDGDKQNESEQQGCEGGACSI